MAATELEPEAMLAEKYPAKEHCRRVREFIARNGGNGSGVLYLEAQKTRMNEDNDQEAPFRQRRYFFYLTGCELPDCYLTYDMKRDWSTLFIPPVNPEEVIWSGLPLSPEEAIGKYDVDEVLPSTELNSWLASSGHPKSDIYAIRNQVSDDITFLSDETHFRMLKWAIDECRVVKSPYEVALIKHANKVSTLAHAAVMRRVKGASNERELGALFLKVCMENGCKEQAYSSIVAAGTSAATLHYVRNDQPLAGKQLLLLDAGAELSCYASDITRTFPINGRFTPEARAIYDIVLRMQSECLAQLKAGVEWDSVHASAHRIAISGLLDLGILRGDRQEIFDARTSVAFFPHGLGHYLGMDTHDTGGHPDYQDPDPMFRYLRVRGKLPAGSVVTVEPGVYFCRFIIEPYLKDEKHAKYIDRGVLERYWEVGGVRIEDNVLITAAGYENLTPTPKEVPEMERLINGS